LASIYAVDVNQGVARVLRWAVMLPFEALSL
jgi:hypothetical protein